MWVFLIEFNISVEHLLKLVLLVEKLAKIVDWTKNNEAAHWSSRLLKDENMKDNWSMNIMITLFSSILSDTSVSIFKESNL